mmetsp:Transcript_9209/g.18556  ORF Transcript_9209/g.18556 Transcript_9209/m.18556 type:complete len:246 (+) Transcript_9209:190-927(+)
MLRAVLTFSSLLPAIVAFSSSARCGVRRSRQGIRASAREFPPFVPREVEEIQEDAALSMLRALKRVDVPVNGVSVPTSFYGNLDGAAAEPVILLLHGFDSFCLEWRRLVPLLEDCAALKPKTVVALDVLGWGFTDASSSPTTSARAKRDHLFAFWKQVREEEEEDTQSNFEVGGSFLRGPLFNVEVAGYTDTTHQELASTSELTRHGLFFVVRFFLRTQAPCKHLRSHPLVLKHPPISTVIWPHH